VDVVIALHAAAAVLLLIAGAAKVSRPVPTSDMIASLGLPALVWGVRTLGVVEMALAVAALGVGGPWFASAVGVLYSLFTIVVVRALAVGATSCGCFGRADTPPSWLHVTGNALFAIASFVAASADQTPVDAMGDQPASGAPYVLLIGVIAGLAVVGFTALPEALAARRPGSSRPEPFRLGDRAEPMSRGGG
jgi:hypothetical protein